MPYKKTSRKIVLGNKAKYSGFGLKGCSHGMYSSGGFNFYVFGIGGLIAYEVMERWGDFMKQ